MMSDAEILQAIRHTLELEIGALQKTRAAVGVEYARAVQEFLNCKGKIIVTGMGKSGHIARKIAATLSSTGTRAVFLHPAEAMHGDLGVAERSDIVLAISKSGESDELTGTLQVLKKMGLAVVAITARANSSLGRIADILLLTPLDREACPLDLAPTSSTTVALAVGDALAMTLMKLKNFQPEDFALYHPAGRLGRRLLYEVRDLMIPKEKCPLLKPAEANFSHVVTALGSYGLGIVLFSADGVHLDGILTDGDIRRLIDRHGKAVFDVIIEDVMNKSPLTTRAEIRAVEALEFMEKREKPLNVLPVVHAGVIQGIVRLHELVRVS